MAKLQAINFFSIGNSGSTGALRSSSRKSVLVFVCDIMFSCEDFDLLDSHPDLQLAKGGVWPWKKIHEIVRPTQITKPKILTA
jgi:hypothetical protein